MDDVISVIVYIAIGIFWFWQANQKKSKPSEKPTSVRRRQVLEEELESFTRKKNHLIVIRGIHHYADHPALGRIIQRYSGWDEAQVRAFLDQNTILKIHGQAPQEAITIIADLNQGRIPVDSFDRSESEDLIVLKARVKKLASPAVPVEPIEPKHEKVHAHASHLVTQLKKISSMKSNRPVRKAKASDPIKQTEIGTAREKDLLKLDVEEIIHGFIYSEILAPPVTER